MSSYVLVVGFHHKKGTSVEYVYPELETGLDLPPAWNFIPPIALPDGAHNFDRDYIFFTVPSLEQKPTTLFGVACFRQVDARKFSNPTPDLTRNSVQKSVVFLSPAALFGAVCRLLDDVTDDFISASSCEEGYEILRRGFEDIQAAVNKIVRSSSFEDVLLQGLSAVSFVRAYQREALVLLKILLLERRVLFACETAVHCMSTWLLTLISLIPGMLNGGLSTCALVDDTWVGERACWPLATLSRSSIFDDGSANASTDVPIVQESNEEFTGEENSSTPTDFAQSRVGALRTGATSLWSNVTKTASSVLGSRPSPTNSTSTTTATIEQPSNSNSTVHQTGSTVPPQAPSSNAASHDVYSALPPLTDGSVFDCALPTDDWGLPLALFSRSYLFLPYVPLHALDMLLEFRLPPKGDTTPDPLAIGGRRVRGFLCGTTNPLLSQNTRLAEAIVHTLPFPSTEASKVSGGGDLAPQVEGQNLEASGDLEIESTDPGQRVGFPSDSHSSNRTGGVLSRLLNRQQSTIRICPPSTEPGGRLRDLPMPLNRAIQLSRFDRIFIDHLVNTAELWYSAKAAKEVDTSVSAVPAGSEEITPRQIAETEVLAKFPELTDLEKWIRGQFSVYIKSLLLASEGRGGYMNDYNFNFVSCFRTTHNFLVWRSQYVLPSVMQQIAEEQKQLEEMEEAKMKATGGVNGKMNSQPDESKNADEHDGQMRIPNSAPPQPTRDIYAIGCPITHPGRNFPSLEPADQIVNNLRHKRFSANFSRFGNIAADQGRRMLNGLMKLGNEKNGSGGASLLRRFASNVRSALDSVQSPTIPTEDSRKPPQL